jgi:hypothetical protein
MKKFVRFGLFALLSVFIGVVFSGCAPSVKPPSLVFNPNNTSVNFANGKPYAIPYGSQYFWAQNGTNVDSIRSVCGDQNKALWIEESAYKRISANGASNFYPPEVKPLFAQSLAGCAAPLSVQALRDKIYRNFNPNNTGVNFANGKPFAIPYGSQYFWAQDGTSADFIRSVCGDQNKIFWIESALYNGIFKDKGLTAKAVKPYLDANLANCLTAMSDQELQYRMKQDEMAQQKNMMERQMAQQQLEMSMQRSMQSSQQFDIALQQQWQQLQQQTQNNQHNLQMIQLNNNLNRLYNQRMWGF